MKTFQSQWKRRIFGSDSALLDQQARTALEMSLDQMTALSPDSLSFDKLFEIALLCGYAHQSALSPVAFDVASSFLEIGIDRIGSSRLYFRGLHGGLAGAGWIIQHLGDLLNDGEEALQSEDHLSEIDLGLCKLLDKPRWTESYDLIGGSAGYAVYFLERLPRAVARRGLELVWTCLRDLAQPYWGGTAWYTPPDHLPQWQRDSCPDGYYNLGVAHGAPGVVAVLAEMLRAGIETRAIWPILESSMKFLMDREGHPDCLTRYPSWFMPGMPVESSRLGWCYGGLGAGAVFYRMGLDLDRTDWTAFGLKLLRSCLGCSPKDGSTFDAGLCHGSFGNAHIYSRLYGLDGSEEWLSAARFWYDHGLTLARPSLGLGGFPEYRADVGTLVPSCSFLSGAAGASLALISALYDIEPQWDRMLLLSGRTYA